MYIIIVYILALMYLCGTYIYNLNKRDGYVIQESQTSHVTTELVDLLYMVWEHIMILCFNCHDRVMMYY